MNIFFVEHRKSSYGCSLRWNIDIFLCWTEIWVCPILKNWGTINIIFQSTIHFPTPHTHPSKHTPHTHTLLHTHPSTHAPSNTHPSTQHTTSNAHPLQQTHSSTQTPHTDTLLHPHPSTQTPHTHTLLHKHLIHTPLYTQRSPTLIFNEKLRHYQRAKFFKALECR